ncbi:MAG: element excision factor XisH family protein [Saprospiraceae bacterium]
MAQRDKIHEAVVVALEKAGWFVTDDPLIVQSAGTTFKMDLGAEKFVLATKDTEQIAIEIKSLTKISLIYDFYEIFGQYIFYRDALNDENINRTLHLAISNISWKRIQKKPFLLKRIAQYDINILVIDKNAQIILEWIKQ